MNDSQFNTYVTIDGSLIIPDDKPDIKQLLQVISTPVISRVIVQQHKIIFYGEMHIRVKYSTNTQKNSESIHFKAPFANFIEHCHARPSMHAKLSHRIEIENFFVSDCRLISKFIFVKVCIVDLQESCNINSHKENNKCKISNKQNSINSAVICPQCKQRKNKIKTNSEF